MTTQESRWIQMRDLFAQATELPTAERIPFIQRAHVKTDLRSEVISLIHADQCQKKKPLTGAIGTALETSAEERRQERVGSVVEQYRVLNVIGHGGTGTVYLAERLDAVGQSKVAIKIVEGAAINGVARRRFRDERQILANLSHPNIARLFDAGDTRDGYPYLVMDYIDGEPIDRYCDRHRLNIRQRIELFLKVCDAVEYAHQNLIIHRDLKPQNILVTADRIPKLLDFGIAKLLADRAEPVDFAVTQFHDQLLTPAYASPEQVLGKNVSTTSDVYTLGVALYELLAGIKPFAHVNASNHLEYERIVLTQEPEAPSAAVKSLCSLAENDSATLLNIQRIGATRGVPSTRLSALLKGDLDAILLRALRPKAEDRYESVAQLCEDLKNQLCNRPVSAIKHNWLYLSRRFFARNVLPTLSGMLCIIFVIGATITIQIQSKHLSSERDAANREKQVADAVTSFMTEVFAIDDHPATNHIVLARDLLDKATHKIQSNLVEDPSVKAKLLEAIGSSYRHQGHADQAVDLLKQAVEIHRRIDLPNDSNLLNGLYSLGNAQLGNGEIESARGSLLEAASILEKKADTQSLAYARLLKDIGRVEQEGGDADLAQHYLEQAVSLLRTMRNSHSLELGEALISLGFTLQWQGKYVSSESIAREAVEIYRANAPEFHPDRIGAENLLAEGLFRQGYIAESASLIEKQLENKKKVFGSTSTSIVHSLLSMVDVRCAQNRLSEAEDYARQALQVRQLRHGANNYYTAFARVTLASIQWKLGKFSEAEKEVRKALSIYGTTLQPGHAYIRSAEYFLAEILASTKRPAAALEQSNELLVKLKLYNSESWRIARAENVKAQALLLMGRNTEAQQLLEQSYAVLSTSTGAYIDAVQLAHDRLEHFYIASHQYDKLATLRATDQKTNKKAH